MIPYRAFLLSAALTLFLPLVQGMAATTLVTFDGITGVVNFGAIPSSYQPLAAQGVTITYEDVGLFDTGPDHTTGISGGTHWSTYEGGGENTVQTFMFSAPVSAPSMWLTTHFGGTSGRSVGVIIKAYSDQAGQNLVFTDTFTTPMHASGAGNYVWAEYTGLAFGPAFQRIEFTTNASGGNAQLDDITFITTVPEPATAGLLALGTLGVISRRRRKLKL